MKLFPRELVAGIFRGFSQGGLEFHADLVLPYKSEFQSTPMHGQFVVVQLEHEHEAVLGRITSISAQGRLASSAGEDYGIRAVSDDRVIPEDLREQYLKYQVDIRVLGVIRVDNGSLVFAASHRRLPHVGSKVAFLSDEVLREIAGHNLEGAELGYFALGEFVYCGGDDRLWRERWMQPKNPAVVTRFLVQHLVSRRSFVFARAGFGKSNLVKLLFANLYAGPATVAKRGGRQVPVGTVIFDPDGEYFWPDDKGRPGLCDVPELEDKVVVFTGKAAPTRFYDSFVAGSIKLDIRRLKPSEVIAIALPPEKQDQQNVVKLKSLRETDWRELVDEVYRNWNAADPELIRRLLRLEPNQEAEMVAARANMARVVRMLHDPSSQMMDMLLTALQAGKICVVDVSQMRGTPSLVLSGLILQRIFEHNQDEFTKMDPQTIPTIAVVEEAQSVLGSSGSSGEGPYVTWVKEGRKFDLGAVLITQQPGSLPFEILSQGDNWFVFHLLSAGDLQAVKRANAHFSDDLLSTLLNEPIPGHAVHWSSAGGKSYPLSIRVMSFESLFPARDLDGRLPEGATFAKQLKERYERALAEKRPMIPAEHSDETASQAAVPVPEEEQATESEREAGEPVDVLETYIAAAIGELRKDNEILGKIRSSGWPWKGVQVRLAKALPDVVHDREQLAYQIVPRAMNEILGKERWKTERRPRRSGSGTTAWIITKR